MARYHIPTLELLGSVEESKGEQESKEIDKCINEYMNDRKDGKESRGQDEWKNYFQSYQTILKNPTRNQEMAINKQFWSPGTDLSIWQNKNTRKL